MVLHDNKPKGHILKDHILKGHILPGKRKIVGVDDKTHILKDRLDDLLLFSVKIDPSSPK
jgi:hypothetical protein